MKLQLKKARPVESRPWHPDFRTEANLPDLKVVRTSFFLNLVWVTAAAAAVLFTGYREYTAASLNADIKAAEQRIEANRAANANAVRLNKEFVDASRRFAEAEKFGSQPFRASVLMRSLASSLPDDMDFSSIAMEGARLRLNGVIRGASDSASSRLSAYLDVLRSTAEIADAFPEVSLTNMSRDPASQGLSFEIQLTQKPAKAPKA